MALQVSVPYEHAVQILQPNGITLIGWNAPKAAEFLGTDKLTVVMIATEPVRVEPNTDFHSVFMDEKAKCIDTVLTAIVNHYLGVDESALREALSKELPSAPRPRIIVTEVHVSTSGKSLAEVLARLFVSRQ